MVVIVNELSLSGQYTGESFIRDAENFIPVLKMCKSLKIQLSKKTTFFQAQLTERETLRDFIVRAKDDAITRFKSILVPLTDGHPYWDIDKRHSCLDRYECMFTEDKCDYGLAEAVEVDKAIFSFKHHNFDGMHVEIAKNQVPQSLCNIFSRESLVEFLFRHGRNIDFEYLIDTKKRNNEKYFPNKEISNPLMKALAIEGDTANLHQEERISIYKVAGTRISLLNCWKLCPATTRRNDRDVYKKTINANYHYLTIDSQHGRFELFDSQGMHIGEYYFSGEFVPGSKADHSITV